MAVFEHLLICIATGFLVSWAVVRYVLRTWHRQFLPGRAEFHHSQIGGQNPVPRFGGLGLAAAFVVVFCLLGLVFGLCTNPLTWVVAGTSLAMFGLGFWDDIKSLGAKRKLLGQIVIASAAYFLGLGIHVFKIPVIEQVINLGFYSWPITVFWLVAMTNLINLIDGVDGLAGGIALMVMVLLTAVGDTVGAPSRGLLSAGMVGALLGFLRFNFPPAKIYLGDGGAYFLGFLIGGLTIGNSQKGTVVAALIAPLFVLALPILDTTLALLRRGLNGLPLFRPDQGHLHHRLLQSGLSRQSVTLGAYAFTAYFLGLGLLAFCWSGHYLALACGGATAALLLLAFRFNFSRSWFNVGEVLGNSLQARAEINYALAHSRWLALEGARGRSVQSICEDTASVARRLGFVQMRIQIGQDEAVWRMTDCPNLENCGRKTFVAAEHSSPPSAPDACNSYVFRHQLPGQTACCIELQTPNLKSGTAAHCSTGRRARKHQISPSKYKIVSEVLAEGWAKSLAEWQRRNQRPIRLAGQPARNNTPPSFHFGTNQSAAGPAQSAA